MSQRWLASYPQNVQPSIDIDTELSVCNMLQESVARFADKPAFHNAGTSLSYAKLDKLSSTLAAYLSEELKLNKGDAVAIMVPNLLQYPVALFGILKAGLIVTNINPMYTPRELKHQLNDSGSKAIIILADMCAKLEKIIEETSVSSVIVTEASDLIGQSPAQTPTTGSAHSFLNALQYNSEHFQEPELSGEDIAFLQYTGGTTGPAKGATLTHGNLVANLSQFKAWCGSSLTEGEEVVITALPLYHIFALTVNCLAFMSIGGLNVLITNPRDMPGFVAELSKWSFTAFTGVNTLYNGLLHTPGFEEVDFSALHFCIGGGAAVQRPIAEKWAQVTGCQLTEGYGLSETSPLATVNPFGDTSFRGSIGLPIPSTLIEIRDMDGLEVASGETGEICIKGPQVMRGYWNKPEANEEAFTDDGFFRTGDIATMDDEGYIRIVDRKKDMILVSGFNVYPNEIEEVAAGCEGVKESACIGIPNEKSGEAVKLFVVADEGCDISEASVRAYCREHLAAYKVPSTVVFLDALPQSAVGKILRRELRKM